MFFPIVQNEVFTILIDEPNIARCRDKNTSLSGPVRGDFYIFASHPIKIALRSILSRIHPEAKDALDSLNTRPPFQFYSLRMVEKSDLQTNVHRAP